MSRSSGRETADGLPLQDSDDHPDASAEQPEERPEEDADPLLMDGSGPMEFGADEA